MTRYKNILGKLARALATLPHAASGAPLNGLTQDERDYRQDHRSVSSKEEVAGDKPKILGSTW